MSTRIQLSDLLDAFEWASATGPFDNAAYVTKASGRIWLVSDFDDAGEEPPDDVGDESLYLSVPRKDELDLGRSLALRFAKEHLPDSYEKVRDFFGRSGAFAPFKRLLDAAGQLDAWHAYEAKGIEAALRAWAADQGVELAENIGEPGS